MPRNGSGVFSPPAANYPAVSGTVILAANRNAVDADVATAITNSIAVNGESVVTNNIPFAGNKITGLGAGTLATDAATLSQVQSGVASHLGSVTGEDTITATLTPSLTAYALGQLFKLVPVGDNTGAVTLNINGLGAKDVTKSGTNALVAGDLVTGAVYLVEYDGTRFQAIDVGLGGSLTGAINTYRATVVAHATTTPMWIPANGNVQDWTGTPTITVLPNAPQAGAQRIVYPAPGTIITHGGNISVQGNASYTAQTGDEWAITSITTSTFYVTIERKDGTAVAGGSKIQSIDYTLSANALTLKLNPTSLDFRSTTLTSGAPTTISNVSQITTTISSGSTGGTVSAIQSDIYIIAINNAGTMELAWCNASGGINLDETTLINTTAEGGAGAADSSIVIYSTTARTGVAFRVVGVFRSTQTTAGTWAQTPSLVQGYGGQALTAMGSLGYGQKPQAVTRLSAITYYSMSKPIKLNLSAVGSGSAFTLTSGGYTYPQVSNGSTAINSACSYIIPPNSPYSYSGAGTVTASELS